jgi:hypothetical protein
MRQIAVFVAVVSLLVFGFGFGVNAQPPRQPAEASAIEQRTTPVGQDITRELRRIRSLAPNVSLCSRITAASNVSKLIDCLNRVTKFAKATQKELSALDKFVNKFFNCTSYTQVSQYGIPPNSGYVYDPGTGVTFKTSALDLTEDLSTDAFLNYHVVKPTIACIAFAD